MSWVNFPPQTFNFWNSTIFFFFSFFFHFFMVYRHPNNRATAGSTGIRPARRRQRIRPPALTPPTIPMACTRHKDFRPRSRPGLPRELPRICGSGFKRWIPTGKSGWISGKSAVTPFFFAFFLWKKNLIPEAEKSTRWNWRRPCWTGITPLLRRALVDSCTFMFSVIFSPKGGSCRTLHTLALFVTLDWLIVMRQR